LANSVALNCEERVLKRFRLAESSFITNLFKIRHKSPKKSGFYSASRPSLKAVQTLLALRRLLH